MKPIYPVSARNYLINEPKKLHLPQELFELFERDEFFTKKGGKNDIFQQFKHIYKKFFGMKPIYPVIAANYLLNEPKKFEFYIAVF